MADERPDLTITQEQVDERTFRARLRVADERDWTVAHGKANSSWAFAACVNAVTDILTSHSLGMSPRATARVIVAHLAHKHGLAPKKGRRFPVADERDVALMAALADRQQTNRYRIDDADMLMLVPPGEEQGSDLVAVEDVRRALLASVAREEPKEWYCGHCEEHFTTETEARAHGTAKECASVARRETRETPQSCDCGGTRLGRCPACGTVAVPRPPQEPAP